jgi:hypothetical protein
MDNFIELCGPFGIKEVARSGAVAMVRGNAARLRIVEREDREETGRELPPTGTDSDIMGVV